jgi:hypothetical protein
MKRYTFQATTRGLCDVVSTREKGLKKAFEKWLKAQGLIIVSVDVIEQEDK